MGFLVPKSEGGEIQESHSKDWRCLHDGETIVWLPGLEEVCLVNGLVDQPLFSLNREGKIDADGSTEIRVMEKLPECLPFAVTRAWDFPMC